VQPSTLVERWTGTKWVVMSSPNSGTTGTALYGISCVSAVLCQAAGHRQNGGTEWTTIETWRGARWDVSATPNLGMRSVFSGISCDQSAECLAVGATNSGMLGRALIERWKGVGWTVVSTPNRVASTNELYAVAKSSPTTWIAVGESNINGGRTLALIGR
jgi:hypothetical protein